LIQNCRHGRLHGLLWPFSSFVTKLFQHALSRARARAAVCARRGGTQAVYVGFVPSLSNGGVERYLKAQTFSSAHRRAQAEKASLDDLIQGWADERRRTLAALEVRVRAPLTLHLAFPPAAASCTARRSSFGTPTTSTQPCHAALPRVRPHR
jgi:hypothetical protein